jgi:hypothetical protein
VFENVKMSFYEDEENLKVLCDFLRSSEGPAVREALLMEKRVHYLKGKASFIAIRLDYSFIDSC